MRNQPSLLTPVRHERPKGRDRPNATQKFAPDRAFCPHLPQYIAYTSIPRQHYSGYAILPIWCDRPSPAGARGRKSSSLRIRWPSRTGRVLPTSSSLSAPGGSRTSASRSCATACGAAGRATEDNDAVHNIDRHRPGVVILDYELPGMTGVEMAFPEQQPARWRVSLQRVCRHDFRR